MMSFFYRIILIGLSVLFLSSCQDDAGKTTLIIQSAQNQAEEIAFSIEVADTVEKRAQGLMNRDILAQESGMLFIFPTQDFQSFWMKDTHMPLDILFINEKGFIGHIHHHAMPNDLTPIRSQIPARYALEINGGVSAQHTIQVGDQVLHERITQIQEKEPLPPQRE